MDTQEKNIFSLSKQDTSVMKGIAILAMLCHHLYAFPPDGVEPYIGVLAWLGVLGKVCVALFLFCSGYGLAANYKPISIKDDLKFIGRRLVKFYLNYWVIFLIFVPITIFAFHRPLSAAYGDNYIWWHLILDILGLQGAWSYNITWWFNKLIIILYALFPLLYRAINIKPWLVILLGLLLMRKEFHLVYAPVGISTWQFPFVLGIVWKVYAEKGFEPINERLSKHSMSSFLLASGLLLITLIVRMYSIIPHWGGMRMDGFVACALALFVVVVLRKVEFLMMIFSYLGKHSMNIYMIHAFFNGYWHSEWLHEGEWMRGDFAILILLSLAVSIVVEYVKKNVGLYKLEQIISTRIK